MGLSLLFSITLLAFLLVIAIYSLSYPFEAQLFPWVIGVPGLILMFLQVLKEISKKRRGTEKEGLPEERSENVRGYLLTVGWMLSFLIMIYVLGFLVSIPLFLFLYLKLQGLDWLQSLGLAAVSLIVIYGIFTIAMEMDFYPGILFS